MRESIFYLSIAINLSDSFSNVSYCFHNVSNAWMGSTTARWYNYRTYKESVKEKTHTLISLSLSLSSSLIIFFLLLSPLSFSFTFSLSLSFTLRSAEMRTALSGTSEVTSCTYVMYSDQREPALMSWPTWSMAAVEGKIVGCEKKRRGKRERERERENLHKR